MAKQSPCLLGDCFVVLVMTIGDKISVEQRRCQGYEEQVGISLLLLRVLRISSRPSRFKIFIFFSNSYDNTYKSSRSIAVMAMAFAPINNRS